MMALPAGLGWIMPVSSGGPAAYWDPAAKDAAVDLTNGNATATVTSGSGWVGVRGVTSHSTGKWYAEILLDVDTTNGDMLFGVCTSAYAGSSFVGSTATSWGIQANNTSNLSTYNGGTQTGQGSGTNSITEGGRAMVAYDPATGRIWLGSNGVWFGSGNPSAGTNPAYTTTAGNTLFLAVSHNGSGQSSTLKNNTGENIYTIPTGFSMWG